jgi:hypothetical protein
VRLDTYSDKELKRIYRKVYRRTREVDLAGGGMWGMDWPTLRAYYPRRARLLKEILRRIEVTQ